MLLNPKDNTQKSKSKKDSVSNRLSRVEGQVKGMRRMQSDDECDCNDDIDWDFPIICWILERLWVFIPQISPFLVSLMHWIIIFIAERFDCPNIP